MLQNLRYSLRSWGRTPGFTIAALICLALGIGATSAIFSIVSAVLLKPLSYPDSGKLVRIYTEFPHFPGGGLHKFWVSEPEVFNLKTADSFSAVGAWATTGANLASINRPLRITATCLSADLMQLLEVKPLLGHLITPEEDVTGAAPVIVLSYALWKAAFAGDPGIAGKHTYLNNTTATIIGVMPNGFAFPPGETEQTQAWTALQLDPKSRNFGGHNYNVLGRLRPGVTLAQARSEMSRLVARWGEAESPKNHVLSPKDHPVTMYQFYDEVTGGVRKAILMLLGAVGFLLLIACVNVANLLLARSEARQREIAVRRAIGASNRDLLKQFVIEGATLSLAGAGLGILLAIWSINLIRKLNPGNIPRVNEIHIDAQVLWFTLAVSVLTGVLFGLAPFVHVSAIRVFESLKASTGRSSSSAGSNRFRRLLVVAQIAMAFLLVSGAGLMVRGFWKLQAVNPGFNPRHRLTFSVDLPHATYKDAAAMKSFWRRAQERIAGLPGAESVTLMTGLPPLRPENDNDTEIEGFVPVPNGPIQNVAFWQIAADRFFETLGARLIEGRFLEPRDGSEQTPGVVVNQTMARTFWPHESAIGRRLRPGGSKTPWFRVVGVIADIKNAGLDKPAGTELFLPYRVMPYDYLDGAYVVVKTVGDPLRLARAARREIAAIDSTLPIAHLRTMDDVIDAATSRPRFLTVVLGLFSALALALAAVGIYGLMSYSVEQRTSEFGIKLALGAAPRRLMLHVVLQAVMLGVVGIAAGALGAAFLTRSLEGLLFGVSQADLSSFAGTAAILICSIVAACTIPALRAMRVEPVKALRYE